MCQNPRTSAPDTPGVRIYPPLFFAGGLAIGFLGQWIWPLPLGGEAIRPALCVAGFAALLLGIVFDAWALAVLIRAGTSPNPMKPTATLVSAGPYRFSRNPVYVGYVLLQAGIALLADTFWPLATLPVVLIAVRRLVIAREELYLEAKFGDAYRDYKRRVRRWL